jgi:UDP-N-acetylglucosamine--N-acetylmuramyl-(pentapeptide) pyrophosphoryl-undecaprenol N-acetylglucosamine transferase
MAEQIKTVLDNPDGATKMARAALGVGKPDATQALVSIVETLAEKGQP